MPPNQAPGFLKDTPYRESAPKRHRQKGPRRVLFHALAWGTCITTLLAGVTLWLGLKAETVQEELTAASSLLPKLKENVLNGDSDAAAVTLEELKKRTAAARAETADPLWSLAMALPWIGANFSAAMEISTSADDVVRYGATPLVNIFDSLDWDRLLPSDDGSELANLNNVQPQIVSAAQAVRASSHRLDQIDTAPLLPQIREPLLEAREKLAELRVGIDTAADVATIAPRMLGSDSPRLYLVLVQNNAEVRATGGIPGALALLRVHDGKLTLEAQSSAGRLGSFVPPFSVAPDQQIIYTTRLGKYMQDVNLTPDFTTAAATAQAMWEQSTGQKTDGVISVDPVALSYILEATGPLQLTRADANFSGGSLPTTLTHENAVQTLLSDVYAEIDDTGRQDAYFAGVAAEIFKGLSDKATNRESLVAGLSRAATERRILLWSGEPEIQDLIQKYPLSGAVEGPSTSPAEFGVYFNDGTGAKMDYYVKRTVQLVQECTGDEYGQVKVRITSTNTAPADAAESLPAYVTGDGVFGVPPGEVQTNVAAYGPAQAHVETAMLDGKPTDFAPYVHGSRPVGILAIRIAPGETKTVEITFGKIVQHTEPNLVVTPTVQPVKDVLLPAESIACG